MTGYDQRANLFFMNKLGWILSLVLSVVVMGCSSTDSGDKDGAVDESDSGADAGLDDGGADAGLGDAGAVDAASDGGEADAGLNAQCVDLRDDCCPALFDDSLRALCVRIAETNDPEACNNFGSAACGGGG